MDVRHHLFLRVFALLLLGGPVAASAQTWHRTPEMPNLQFGRTCVDDGGVIWTGAPGIGICSIDPLTKIPRLRFRTQHQITSIMAKGPALLFVEERFDSSGAPEHRLYRSVDRGESWDLLPDPHPVAKPVRLFRNNDRTLYLGCTHGLVLLSNGEEFGSGWQEYHQFEAHAEEADARVYSLAGVAPDHWATIVSAVSEERRNTNRLYRQISTESWSPIDVSAVTPLPVWEVSTTPWGAHLVSTVGSRASIPLLVSDDSGTTWREIGGGTRVYSSEPGSFLGEGDLYVWYSSDWGAIGKSSRTGGAFLQSWRLIDFYVNEHGLEYVTLGMLDEDRTVLVYTTYDAYRTIPYMTGPIVQPFVHGITDRRTTSIVVSGPRQWYAIQEEGRVWQTTDQGSTWSRIADAPFDTVRHAVFYGEELYISGSGGIYRYRPRQYNRGWQPVMTDVSVSLFTMDPTGTMILDTDAHGIVRFDPEEGFDSLASYSPARTAGAEIYVIDRVGQPIVRTADAFYRLSTLGDFWSVISPPVSTDSVRALLYIDHRTQVVADRHTVWRTIDAGATWNAQLRTDDAILELALATASPFNGGDGPDVQQIVALTDHEIWSSYDLGEHWNETTGDLPAQPGVTGYVYDEYAGLHVVALDGAGLYWSERNRASSVRAAESSHVHATSVDREGAVELTLARGLLPHTLQPVDLLGRPIPGDVEVLAFGVDRRSRVRWIPRDPVAGVVFFHIEGPEIGTTIKVVVP